MALGNITTRVCVSYNACVRTFAGSDADVVAWEQSLNCGRDAEAFLRSLAVTATITATATVTIREGSG